jgi:hypothetical protein
MKGTDTAQNNIPVSLKNKERREESYKNAANCIYSTGNKANKI